MNISFAVKDARRSLISAISELLDQETGGIAPLTHSAGGYIVRCTPRSKTVKGVAVVNLRINVTSSGRKAFARAVGEITGCEAVYNGVPSFTYTVGEYIVDREGVLICPATANQEGIDRLIAALSERGYEVDKIAVSDTDDVYDTSEEDGDKLVISMPTGDFTERTFDNLAAIIASKEQLIKKALGTDSLHFYRLGNTIRFPWFTLTGTDGEMDAYLRFITALCRMAKTQQRVTAKEQDTDNDKFAMRIFLVRLGLKGPEFKQTRKILLRNLEGNSSWKNGQPPTRAAEHDEEV